MSEKESVTKEGEREAESDDPARREENVSMRRASPCAKAVRGPVRRELRADQWNNCGKITIILMAENGKSTRRRIEYEKLV